eukprot:6368682-Prymnesium_polylepis.1
MRADPAGVMRRVLLYGLQYGGGDANLNVPASIGMVCMAWVPFVHVRHPWTLQKGPSGKGKPTHRRSNSRRNASDAHAREQNSKRVVSRQHNVRTKPVGAPASLVTQRRTKLASFVEGSGEEFDDLQRRSLEIHLNAAGVRGPGSHGCACGQFQGLPQHNVERPVARDQ